MNFALLHKVALQLICSMKEQCVVAHMCRKYILWYSESTFKDHVQTFSFRFQSQNSRCLHKQLPAPEWKCCQQMMAHDTCVIGLSYLGLYLATCRLLTLYPSAVWILLMCSEYRFCVPRNMFWSESDLVVCKG